MSYAVDWIDIGKSNDKTLQTFLDYDSVKNTDLRVIGDSSSYSRNPNAPSYINAVFQQTYINSHPSRKKGYYYSKEQWIISCKNETYFIKAYVDYGFKDEVLNSWSSPKVHLSNSDFKYAFPETVASNNLSYACLTIDAKES